LVMLLGEEGKRRLRLRQMTNDQLFEAYDAYYQESYAED